jgi:hypothetical protein
MDQSDEPDPRGVLIDLPQLERRRANPPNSAAYEEASARL